MRSGRKFSTCLRPLIVALLVLSAVTRIAVAADHAVVLLYHHVSNQTPALTSVSPQVFEQHLDYLEKHGFTVWSLEAIVDAFTTGRGVPENTVAITFDDAYSTVYSEAFPRLRSREWPFTVFVGTEAVDQGYNNYMTWQQLRELAASGVELSNHSDSHGHLVRHRAGESERSWRERVTLDVNTAADRLRPVTRAGSTLFSYPYGEYSDNLKQLIQSLGYRGIGQQSGAVGPNSDFLALPRFPMSVRYSDMDRFALAVRTRPLPVRNAIVIDRDATSQHIERLKLVFGEGDYLASQIACYSASGERLQSSWLKSSSREMLVELNGVDSPGRNKLNCTAPVNGEAGAYYWYSYQWLVRNSDGSWYRE